MLHFPLCLAHANSNIAFRSQEISQKLVFHYPWVFKRITLRILKDVSVSDCEEAVKVIEQKAIIPLPLKILGKFQNHADLDLNFNSDLDNIDKQWQTHLKKYV